MPRYRLTIAYDGTDFCGWQRQEPPDWTAPVEAGADRPRRILRTVQGVVQDAVRHVVREPVDVHGASRTDSGVHAAGQVAAFSTSEGVERGRGWPPSRGTEPLLRAINSRLPDDVVVLAADIVADDFNPISHAVAKGYSYQIHLGPDRPLWDRRYVYRCRHALDAARMQAAAARLVGEHDFSAFAATGHGRATTVRTVFDCRAERTGEQRVRIDIAGNGFLWNMVRIIGGTLVEVGRGRLEPDDMARILDGRDRALAGPTLPPEGLRLEWVRYREAAGEPRPGPPGGTLGAA